MEEPTEEESRASPAEKVRDFLDAQLTDLEDPGNVHKVRERLYGRRWTEHLDMNSLEPAVAESVTGEVERAWGALARYPWDLYGAQQALKSAVDKASG